MVLNATVYTAKPGAQRVEALAVKAGRFIAVGTNEAVRASIGKRTQVFDAHRTPSATAFGATLRI